MEEYKYRFGEVIIPLTKLKFGNCYKTSIDLKISTEKRNQNDSHYVVQNKSKKYQTTYYFMANVSNYYRKLELWANLKLTSLLKSAGIRQSYPNSTRIPNCTPVMGIGAPTLYVKLKLRKGIS